MCSIVGLLDKNGEDVKDKLVNMLEITSHRGPDGCGIVMGTQLQKGTSLELVDTSHLSGSNGMGHLRLQITGKTGTQPLFGCERRFVLGFNGEIWNFKQLRKNLQDCGHRFETDSDSEVIVHLIEENYRRTASFSKSVIETTKALDGEWAFAVIDNTTNKTILARDSVGVKQLYYGSNSKHIGFSSEKKPLLKLGIKPRRVMPGNIVEITFDNRSCRHDFKISNACELKKTPVTIFDEVEAFDAYRRALFKAVKKRIDGQKHIGIIFSGGVDSVLIAQVASKMGAKITCYASGSEDSSDLLAARKVANELGFELKESIITEEKIASNLENIITAIESTDHLQVDVAIPVFFAVQKAKEDGIRVMLTGQGADELFAGYPWYPQIMEEDGPDALNQSLWNDIKNLYKDTLEREDKITMFHSIELRVPYLDPEVIASAMSISENLKIKDGFGKYIHRRLAESVGVTNSVSWRPKEAAQHGSDAHKKLYKVLRQIAKTIKTKTQVPKTDFEKLGSAYRYNHDVYLHNKEDQAVLGYLGAKLGFN